MSPPVWRRITVPAVLSFSQLAFVLNAVMGWAGYHLYSFSFFRGELQIEEDSEEFGSFENVWEAGETCIDELLPHVKSFTYTYDFGDNWRHTVSVEKCFDSEFPHARLIKYKGETPLEDCGGPWGFEELADTLSNPEDPEYEDMMEWSGGRSTQEFDADEVEELLESTALNSKKVLPMSYYDIDQAVSSGKGFSRIRFPGIVPADEEEKNKSYRTLSEKDGKLFYELWLPLLDYVNQKYKVNKSLGKMAGAPLLDPAEVKKVADRLWATPNVIDNYLAQHSELPEDHRSILLSWKRCVKGKFILERHLKSGSILLGEDGGEDCVYQVVGTISPWPEMYPEHALPCILDVALIPFRDVIISDGLNMTYPVSIGRNMTEGFKDIYRKAKAEKKIIRKL